MDMYRRGGNSAPCSVLVLTLRLLTRFEPLWVKTSIVHCLQVGPLWGSPGRLCFWAVSAVGPRVVLPTGDTLAGHLSAPGAALSCPGQSFRQATCAGVGPARGRDMFFAAAFSWPRAQP